MPSKSKRTKRSIEERLFAREEAAGCISPSHSWAK